MRCDAVSHVLLFCVQASLVPTRSLLRKVILLNNPSGLQETNGFPLLVNGLTGALQDKRGWPT
jgi:hypothetical protein